MDGTTATLRVLDMLIAGTLVIERAAEMRARIAAMQAEGREPSLHEWETLFAEIASDGDRLDAADKRLNG